MKFELENIFAVSRCLH